MESACKLTPAPKGISRQNWAAIVDILLADLPETDLKPGETRSSRLKQLMRVSRKWRLRVASAHADLLSGEYADEPDTDEPQSEPQPDLVALLEAAQSSQEKPENTPSQVLCYQQPKIQESTETALGISKEGLMASTTHDPSGDAHIATSTISAPRAPEPCCKCGGEAASWHNGDRICGTCLREALGLVERPITVEQLQAAWGTQQPVSAEPEPAEPAGPSPLAAQILGLGFGFRTSKEELDQQERESLIWRLKEIKKHKAAACYGAL